jgi:hypothetical protein
MEGWWYGTSRGTKLRGIFPANYVEAPAPVTATESEDETESVEEDNSTEEAVATAAPTGDPVPAGKCKTHRADVLPSHVKAAYDYTATEAGELSFKAGDIITVSGRPGAGWLLGTLRGKAGEFPDNYVRVYSAL